MELLQLRYFVALAHSQHLTKTAEQMVVSPPAISASIGRLEKELGVQLFDRVGRSVKLNRMGKLYLSRIEQALELIDDGTYVLSQAVAGDANTLTISLWNSVIYDLPVSLFRKEHPEVHLKQFFFDPLVTNSTQPTGACDFIIAPIDSFKNQEWNSKIIFCDHIMLGISPNHPRAASCGNDINLSDFQNEWFIFPSYGSFARRCRELCLQAGFIPKIRVECDYTLRPKLVLEENGVCLTTHTAKLSGIYEGIPIKRIKDPPSERYQALFWKKGRSLSNTAEMFLNFMVEYYKHVEPYE